jgi:hypothetical protein
MCNHLQRLVELGNDHDAREPSSPAKVAFQFTSAAASRWMLALTGAVADSRKQVQEIRRWMRFMMASEWMVLHCCRGYKTTGMSQPAWPAG